MIFDFGKLVNALTNNEQAHLPPNDVFRMGEVVGYDPNWDSTIGSQGGHSYPMVSVQLAGDETPMHGFRFAESYVPNVGDTVFVVLSGEDGWVVASLAGADKDNIGQLRSPSSIVGVITKQDTSVIDVGTGPNIPVPIGGVGTPTVTTTTPFLPNRIYRIEGTVSFRVSNVATGGGTIQGGGSSGSTATITSTGNYPSTTGSTIPHAISFSGHWFYDNTDPDATKIIIDVGDEVAVKSLFDLPNGKAIIVGPNIPGGTVTYLTEANTGTPASSGPPAVPAIPPYVVLSSEIIGGTASGATAKVKDIPSALFGGYPSGPSGSTAAVPFTYTVLNNRTSATGTVTFPAVSAGTFEASNYYSEVALVVKTPNVGSGSVSDPSYLEMGRIDVTGFEPTEIVSMNGFTTYWFTPLGQITPGSWPVGGSQNPVFNWQLCLKPISNTSSSYPVITNVAQHFIVYDCGVAS